MWSIQSVWEELYLYSCYIPTTQCPCSSFLWAVLNPSPWDQCGPGHAGPPNASQEQHWHQQRWFVELKKQTKAWFMTDWSHLGPWTAFLFLFLQLQQEQREPCGAGHGAGAAAHAGSWQQVLLQPLESSDFIPTACHLLKGTFLLRSDKSSINVRLSPLSAWQRPRNIATHQVLVSFVWSIVEWHGKPK